MKVNLVPILKFLEKLSVIKIFFLVIIFPTAMVFITIMMGEHKVNLIQGR